MSSQESEIILLRRIDVSDKARMLRVPVDFDPGAPKPQNRRPVMKGACMFAAGCAMSIGGFGYFALFAIGLI
jgi:hypothetical protein